MLFQAHQIELFQVIIFNIFVLLSDKCNKFICSDKEKQVVFNFFTFV
jgi:hypothetical protein